MKLIFLFPLVLLSGCVYQTVNQFDLYRATKLCGSVETLLRFLLMQLVVNLSFVKMARGIVLIQQTHHNEIL